MIVVFKEILPLTKRSTFAHPILCQKKEEGEVEGKPKSSGAFPVRPLHTHWKMHLKGDVLVEGRGVSFVSHIICILGGWILG